MKRQKHRNSSLPSRRKSLRGRPSKAFQQRILAQGSAHIIEMLNLHLLRQPIDPQFKPYYERILGGDLGAVTDYCDRNAAQKDLDASFYELVGRLVMLRSYRAVNQVLSDIERRRTIGWPSKRDTYEYWYKIIKPICDTTRQFIRAVRRSGRNANREQLWREYVLQPLSTARYLFLVGEADRQLLLHNVHAPIDDQFRPYLERILGGDTGAKADYEEMLQKEQNKRFAELRRSDVEELLKWSESHGKDLVRSRLESMGCRGRELNLLSEGNFQLDHVSKFRPFGMVTRDIFFELAKSNPVLTPAFVARRYACKIVRISESWASRKDMRKI